MLPALKPKIDELDGLIFEKSPDIFNARNSGGSSVFFLFRVPRIIQGHPTIFTSRAVSSMDFLSTAGEKLLLEEPTLPNK